MAIMSGKLYDALLAANVPEEVAREAAEEAAGHSMRVEMGEIRGELRTLKYMVATVGFGVLLILLTAVLTN